jgi:cyclopropane-fatty-acyl-phospholipid synthase
MRLLSIVLRRLISVGRLTVVDAGGNQHNFGDGSGAPVIVRLHDERVARMIAVNPSVAFAEAYMDGRLTVDGDLWNLMELAGHNKEQLLGDRRLTLPLALRSLIRKLQQYNPPRRSRRNAQHHYDLSDALYSLFLDDDRQYSCAYFRQAGLSLEEAQTAKKRHLAAKLLLQPNQRVLDIGSGWGGLALDLALRHAVRVEGITLSQKQLAIAKQRAADAQLGDRVTFSLCDYRSVRGVFDRIVSVGMFEHVGVRHYPAFFRKIRDCMTSDGVMLLHSIGRMDGPAATNAWIRKHIFPGAHVPALSEVVGAIERAGLLITDIEILRLHYAETLRLWRDRFKARREEAVRLYDERFYRMWEFYLAACEMSFRYDGLMVFQIQLAKRIGAVPLTRDYISAYEQGPEPLLTSDTNKSARLR